VRILARVMLLVGWMLVILIGTCSASMEDIMMAQRIEFHFTMNPGLLEMFDPLPSEVSAYFIFRKVGHALVFFILTFLLFSVQPSAWLSGIVALVYAYFTEVLQLFFMRDGRLFDIAFDSVGIVAAMLVAWVGKEWRRVRRQGHGPSV